MTRHLVLFAREPARQAREKGFGRLRDATHLFERFAAGWATAARDAGASLVISTPAEDLAGWRRTPGIPSGQAWIVQKGGSFGDRLRAAALEAASRGGHSVIVGGDVAPCADRLAAAFDALDRGADAVLAAAADGGVSIVAVSRRDADLLARISLRGRQVFSALRDALVARGRRVTILDSARDVDGRTALRGLLRTLLLRGELSRLGRRLLSLRAFLLLLPGRITFERPAPRLPVLRGPPLAA